MAGYQKNIWVLYDEDIPKYEQPNAFITKAKLDNIEHGIENAVTDFKIGTVMKGTEVYCEITADENDPSVKKINMVIPKEVSWLISEVELYDESVAPTYASLNDIILDIKGNIFTVVENNNGVYMLHKRMNIRGSIGPAGEKGETGEPGLDGKDGQDGKDGNKWIHVEQSMFDGDETPENTNIGDFIIDSKFDIFEIDSNFRLKKLFNLRGPEGPQGAAGLSTYDIWKTLGNTGSAEDFLKSLKGEDYYLEIGDVVSGESASAEITEDHKLNLVLPIGPTGIQGPVGETGPAGESTYSIWKALGNTGDAADFLESLKGDPYILEIGDVVSGDIASAEITEDHKLNLVLPAGGQGIQGPEGPVGPPGPAGESTYSIWKALGNTGDAADFIESIKGETGPPATVVDSLDSTSTTEALSANQGRLLKNNRLTTLEEILANEEEGIFVDALAVKELYLKMQELLGKQKIRINM